ncbi:MAG: efflux RND transporter periplasmic adaptor subunit [Thiotrichales bacterium]
MRASRYLPALIGTLCLSAITATLHASPVQVTAKPLDTLTFLPESSVPATVTSLNLSTLSAQITATIEMIAGQVGDVVKPGQTLARLDCRDHELAVQSASVRATLAEKESRRAQSLKQSSNIAEQAVNQAEAELAQARVAQQQARLQVERCVIKAPFAGAVHARLAGEGQLATPGTPLLELLDTQQLEVSAQVPAARVDGLTAAREIRFEHAGETLPVTVRTIAPWIESGARTREVRLRFSHGHAASGTAGRVTWRSNRPHLPADLLTQRDGTVGVLIAEPGDHARFIALPNAELGHPAPIGELPANTRIIVDNRFGLKDGDAVEIR